MRDFLARPIEGDWPYLWLDATYVKVREAGRIVSVAVTIAVGVNAEGRREVLGMAVGASEAEAFWLDFLRGLKRRGLAGVKLVVSDAHEELKAAIARVLGASRQRCRLGPLKKPTRRLRGAAATTGPGLRERTRGAAGARQGAAGRPKARATRGERRPAA